MVWLVGPAKYFKIDKTSNSTLSSDFVFTSSVPVVEDEPNIRQARNTSDKHEKRKSSHNNRNIDIRWKTAEPARSELLCCLCRSC